ncbi:MAG: flavodoxin-dependent (E)-4-hydroxy-3-methylbut-2-enyl-diphosphate synthase [Clostridia bacterium]|nr:flavodoxin-dependent (E)-4-hydroxy-3-methylbut-2-enyl-diphosphate synthase [Clostridia bacterium]
MRTKTVKVGKIAIGGDSGISVQSMTNADPHDFQAVLSQIRRLEAAGCDIVRLTVPDKDAADVLYRIKCAGVETPLVADVHFDYRAALYAIEAGADKIRINPGNIGGEDRVKEVAKACVSHGIPARVGANSGSCREDELKKYGGPTPRALCESALAYARMLKKHGLDDIVISIKSSDTMGTIEANRLLADTEEYLDDPYPLHIGITEAGGGERGIIKGAVGIGALLSEGIGDTVRVSLTDDPVNEVYAAKQILSALGILEGGYVDIVSCPTCGRTKIDVIGAFNELSEFSKTLRPKRKIKAAVMGCAVNGILEAKEADVGIAGGDGKAVLFSHGEIIRTIPEADIIPEMKKYIKELTENI